MRLGVFDSTKSNERSVVQGLVIGVEATGDQALIIQDREIPTGLDAIVLFGIKSLRLRDEAVRRGIPYLYVDKGYTRQQQGWRYPRFCWNGTQPLEYVARARHDSRRWNKIGSPLQPWIRRQKGRVLIAGSSAKYHNWHGLPDPTTYAQELTDWIRSNTDLRVTYRPKPSWDGAVPVDGAGFRRQKGMLGRDMEKAVCLVTHGSNAGLDALVAGVPVVALGPCIVRSVVSTELADIVNPRRCSDAERQQLVNNIAWCQWSVRELEIGGAWNYIKEQYGAC